MLQDKTVFLKKSKVLPFVEMRKAKKSNACYQAHSHDEFSFGVIDTGTANYINMNRNNTINAGDTVTINPGDTHSCNPSSEDWSYRMLFVDTDWIGQVQSEITGLWGEDYQPFSHLLENDENFFKQFELLFNSLLNDSSKLLSETLLIEFVKQSISTKAHIIRREKKPSLVKVRELLLDNLNHNHSLSDLSKESGLSRFHLLRSFKKLYGCSPHSMLMDERIKKAKLMLQSGCSLIEASNQLGFSDQSHFQRSFKKHLAVTPKQYQTFFI